MISGEYSGYPLVSWTLKITNFLVETSFSTPVCQGLC